MFNGPKLADLFFFAFKSFVNTTVISDETPSE
jgi:hypothetical protein